MMFSIRKAVQIACMVALNDGVNGVQLQTKENTNNAFLQKKIEGVSGSGGDNAKSDNKNGSKKPAKDATTGAAANSVAYTAPPKKTTTAKQNALGVWWHKTSGGQPMWMFGVAAFVLFYVVFAASCGFCYKKNKEGKFKCCGFIPGCFETKSIITKMLCIGACAGEDGLAEPAPSAQ